MFKPPSYLLAAPPSLGILPLRLFGVIVTVFGLGIFGVLLHWHLRFEARRAIAGTAQAPAVTLIVNSVRGGNDGDRHWPGVWFDDPRFHDKPFRESSADWHPVPGDRVGAFRFGPDDYYIPVHDNGKFGAGMAIFLSLGLAPTFIGLVLWMNRKRMG